MNAYDNIAYGLKIRGLSKNEIKDRVKEIAELVNVSEILDKKPGRMTQSELQSVALGRTLITKPSLLLLDEPLSNLDAAFRVVMRAELKKFQMEIKQTVIYVTHDQVEAMAMSDKVAVMNLGILQQELRYPPTICVTRRNLQSPKHAVRCRLHRKPSNELFRLYL
jgi:multiple sugar transport system ATP-binding protein